MIGCVICLYLKANLLNCYLFQTSDAVLADRRGNLELGQHRRVQPEPGAQRPGCGHHPQQC